MGCREALFDGEWPGHGRVSATFRGGKDLAFLVGKWLVEEAGCVKRTDNHLIAVVFLQKAWNASKNIE